MDYSQISESLFIGKTPRREDYPLLRALGVQLVINMRFERPPHPDLHPSPIRSLWLPAIDSPLFPIPIRLLRRGAASALAIMQSGGKVYTHCAAGVHRGVAMGAAILIAQGYLPEDAMRLIKECRPGADPYAWHIRRQILRFSRTWDPHPAS